MPSEPGSTRPKAAAERLDSWKGIAAYLGRDVRTVQRWERREGMPVHRHQHDQQASIYAFSAELDAWRESRTAPVLADGTLAPSVTSGVRRRQWAVAALLLVLSSSALAWWARPAAPAPAASRRPVLLLTDAEGVGATASPARWHDRVAESWRRTGGALVDSLRIGRACRWLRARPKGHCRRPSAWRSPSALARSISCRRRSLRTGTARDD